MIVTQDAVEARRAIESMRSGVPSAAAVRTFGSGQEPLERRFRGALVECEESYGRAKQTPGFLFRAGFGGGKSHLLTCFEHIALQENFAVSRVVISKETPLNVPGKLLSATATNLRVPNHIGRGLDEIGTCLQQQFSSPSYRHLVDWLHKEDSLNSRFAATLHLYEKGAAQEEELGDKILRFWSGDKLNVGDVKRYLREVGDITTYRLEPIRGRELAVQTLSFLPHLIRAAGFKGLVLLIDELELVGRYTKLGRAQSYAELARYLGYSPDVQRPGLLAIGAVTDDYGSSVLQEKQDLDLVGDFLSGRDPSSVEPAEEGMRLLQSAALLEGPSPTTLGAAYLQLKALHAAAYSWQPPDVTWPEDLQTNPMRTYVRAWINGWDVRRLYPELRADEGGYVIDQVRSIYSEDPELELQDDDI